MLESELASPTPLLLQQHYRKPKYFSHSLALERTAARRVLTFQMIKTVSVEAKLGPGGGRSACSR
jgi:hypothetical protein